MSMTLTQWWNALKADLERLQSKVQNHQTVPWQTARTIVHEGVQVEQGLLTAQWHANAIDAVMPNLGTAYINPNNPNPQYLPDVGNPEELLFSMVYYQHLSRYQDIDKSTNDLILNGIIGKRRIVQENAQALKNRIDAYLALDTSPDALKTAFPELNNQPGATLFEQLTSLLSALPLEEKLIIQFEAEAQKAIFRHSQSQNALVQIFDDLDLCLKEKELILRQITSCKKLIEELNKENSSLLNELEESTELALNYPNDIEVWERINTPDTETRSSYKKVTVTAARVGIAVTKGFWQGLSWFTSQTVGRFTPEFVNNIAVSGAVIVGGLTDSLTPTSNAEAKKERLVMNANREISRIAIELNKGQNEDQKSRITGKDFEDKDSEQISNLADKVSIIRNFVHIQKTMELYRQKQRVGIVNTLTMDIFGPIVKFLSQTVMRRFIYDRILLSLEAEKLEQRMSQMTARVEASEQLDKAQINEDLADALRYTKLKSDKIPRNSIYAFFEEERRTASQELSKLVENACQKSGLVMGGG